MSNYYGTTSSLVERAECAAYNIRRARWYASVLEQSRQEQEETMTLSAMLGEERLSIETVNAVYWSSRSVEARRRNYLAKPRRQPTQNVMTIPLEGRGRSQ